MWRGMAFPADLAGLATVGVTDLVDVVCSPVVILLCGVIVRRRDFGVARAL